MKEIRDYFKAQARKIDSDIVASKRPLDNEEISQAAIGNTYHLHIGTSTSDSVHNGGIADLYSCSMKIYVSAKNNDNANYDKGYLKARCIRNELVKPENIGEDLFIYDVEPDQIVPSGADGNDKVFIFDINVNVSVMDIL